MGRRGAVIAGAACAAGVAGLAYSLWEATSYRLRRVEVPVLPAGSGSGTPLRILHLSDLHMTPNQLGKRDWILRLAALRPDAVVVTGDFLSHVESVPYVLDALDPLLDLPGAFVLGSNDYFAPTALNPAKYFTGPSTLDESRPALPWPDLVEGLVDAGWADLSNARGQWEIEGHRIDLRGSDDPHIGRDHYESGPVSDDADLTLGVVHAPYKRVIEPMASDGVDLIFAGHTHGGQLCLPGVGALVTNCDLERSRAKGLSHQGDAYLHVSAGLGTSPYAPVRFACPPEATFLTLTSRG